MEKTKEFLTPEGDLYHVIDAEDVKVGDTVVWEGNIHRYGTIVTDKSNVICKKIIAVQQLPSLLQVIIHTQDGDSTTLNRHDSVMVLA